MHLSAYRRVWAFLLLSALLFFIIAVGLTALPERNIPGIARAMAIGLAGAGLLAVAQREEGLEVVGAGSLLAIAFVALTQADQFAPTVILSIGMTAAVFYKFARAGIGVRAGLRELGIVRGRLMREVLCGLFITISIYALLILLNVVYAKFGIQDVDKVGAIIGSAPIHILLLAVLVNPFSEEMFFRGLLAPRIGVIGSSAIFAFFHMSYGSMAEVVNVFVIGIIYAHVYLSRRSLMAPITSHILINASALYIILTQLAGAG